MKTKCVVVAVVVVVERAAVGRQLLLLRPQAPEPNRCSEGSSGGQEFPGSVGEHVDSRAGAERHLSNQRGGRSARQHR